MIDFVDVCAKRIQEMGFKDAKTRKLSDISEGGIAVRRLPSTTLASYYDGTKVIAAIAQVVIARESERQAIEEAEEIAAELIEKDLSSENNSYSLSSVDVYTFPQPLEVNNKVSVWEFKIRAEITIF